MVTKNQAFGLLLCSLAAACDVGAGGRPIVFQVAVAPAAELDLFTTGEGWDVHLAEACVGLGPIYIWAAPSHLGAAAATLRSWALGTAWAHVGDSHFNGGAVRAEFLNPFVVHPLRTDAVGVGLAQGLEGPVGSFSLLLPVVGPNLADATCLRGHSAYVVGLAVKGETSVPFEGGLDIENIGTNRRIDGLPLNAVLTDNVQLRLASHPKVWLDQVAFEKLPGPSASGRFVITPETQAHRAWFIGLRAAGSFTAVVQPP